MRQMAGLKADNSKPDLIEDVAEPEDELRR
jgi:hypothetical protein